MRQVTDWTQEEKARLTSFLRSATQIRDSIPLSPSATEDAAGLQRALARAITDRAGGDALDLLVECRTDDGLTSARVFGSGIGIWNDERQFRLDPDQIGSLLRALQSAGFPGMKDTYGGAPRPARPPGGAMVTIAICRIDLSLGAYNKRAVQLAQGEQSATLKELADDLLEICQAPARLGLTAASLRDGLEKISRGELAPETLRIVAHQKPRKKDDPPGFLLRVAGNRATTRTYAPASGYRDPVVLPMHVPELRALARELAARDPAKWPSNLYAVDYTDLSIRVLNHEKAIQARQFAGLAPSAHGRHQRAFEEVFAILQGLHRNALDQGHLMADPPDTVVLPCNRGDHGDAHTSDGGRRLPVAGRQRPEPGRQLHRRRAVPQ